MQSFAQACEDWDEWDKPAEPFLIHGNTWYVGTCGISAILIEGDDGLVLIDTGTAKGSEVVAANIASLGFKITDVKALLGSHEHFDHVGGMARLQQRAVRRCWSARARSTSSAPGKTIRAIRRQGCTIRWSP